MRELDLDLLADITTGATVLGSGGGGDPYLGMLLARKAIADYGAVHLVCLDELGDDSRVGFIAAVGAPGVLIEKIPRPDDAVAAVTMLEHHLGAPFTHLAPIEAGGLNAVTPIAVCAAKGIPVLDADGMGRAFPLLDMVTPTLYAGRATPMAFADEHGNRMVLETATNAWSEAVGRAVTVASGGIMYFASYPMSGAQAKDWLIDAPLSRAAELGAVLREAQQRKESPVAAVLARSGGMRIIEGRIAGIERRTEGGFNFGEAVIEGLGDESARVVRLLFQNEYLVARDADGVLVTTPDIIMTLAAESGEPVPAEELRYGFRVCLVALPCDRRWHTTAGLALTGPRRFGYDLDAVPVPSQPCRRAPSTSVDPEAEWAGWCSLREKSLRAVPGNLALVVNQQLGTEPESVELLDGVDAWFVPGEAGARLRIAGGIPAEIDGVPVTGEAVLPRLAGGAPYLRCGAIWVDAFSLEGAAYELRIYDERAPAIENLAGIDVYPYDPAMVRAGRFTAYGEPVPMPWEFSKEVDNGRPKAVPGRIVVELPGGSSELIAFLDGSELVLVFADGTTGAESYAPGRFLRLSKPAGDADVVVDFNRAFIPPCAFSDFYSCPLPPAQNRLAMPIRAGERSARWKVDRYAH